MAQKITVTRTALRELVSELLDNKKFGQVCLEEVDDPVDVNPVVDQSAILTDPSNPNYKPNNKAEFQVAVKALSDDLPDEKVSDVYEKLVGALDVPDEKEDTMKNKKTTGTKSATKDTAAESLIRLAVRKQLQELNIVSEAPFDKKPKNFGPVVGPLPPVTKIPAGVHGSEYMSKFDKSKKDLKKIMKNPVEDPLEDTTSDVPERAKFNTVSDVSGASFQDIAKDLGFSVAGAKQAVDKAMLKAQWVADMQDKSPEDLEIIVLSSMNDYIKMLSRSGELSASDVALMKAHPDIVRDLDGFREFLDKSIRRARGGEKLYNPTAPASASPEESGAEASSEPAAPKAPREPKASKDSYKVYKGGQKYNGASVVTRYKGKVFGKMGASEFKPGESGIVSPEDGKLKVKKPTGDHTQVWEPVGESRSRTRTIKKSPLTIVLETMGSPVDEDLVSRSEVEQLVSSGASSITDPVSLESALNDAFGDREFSPEALEYMYDVFPDIMQSLEGLEPSAEEQEYHHTGDAPCPTCGSANTHQAEADEIYCADCDSTFPLVLTARKRINERRSNSCRGAVQPRAAQRPEESGCCY